MCKSAHSPPTSFSTFRSLNPTDRWRFVWRTDGRQGYLCAPDGIETHGRQRTRSLGRSSRVLGKTLQWREGKRSVQHGEPQVGNVGAFREKTAWCSDVKVSGFPRYEHAGTDPCTSLSALSEKCLGFVIKSCCESLRSFLIEPRQGK
eukprot:4126255-Pyramimonas_sp.AAC.1